MEFAKSSKNIITLMENILVSIMFTKKFLTPLVSIRSPLIQSGVKEMHELAKLKLQIVAKIY